MRGKFRQQFPKNPNLCKTCPRFAEQRCAPMGMGQTTDILVIAPEPDPISASSNWPFNGHAGRIVREAVKTVQTNNAAFKDLNIEYTYAVQCRDAKENAADKKVMEQCLPFLQSTIESINPKLIVCLGAPTLRQLGFKVKHKDTRGRMLRYVPTDTPVLVTFSDKALLANPGLFEVFCLDLKNGFTNALGLLDRGKVSLEDIAKEYVLPKTIDEAIDLCDHIRRYAGSGDPNDWAISVDTETTTLHPEKEDAKIIAFCFGWDTGKATTILYEHPYAPPEYSERLSELTAAIKRLLLSPKPKILHNSKFDLEFIELKYGLTVNNVVWDTLLGEHLLNEDAKGTYGLKALTTGWLPRYTGYEDKLYDLLLASEGINESDRVESEVVNLRAVLSEDHPEYLEEMQMYLADLRLYEANYEQYQEDIRAYNYALDDYEFCRSHLAGLQAAWKAEIVSWPKGQKGKPKKPAKWFSKPTRPSKPRAPKKPEDPRSKTEKRVTQDAGFEKIPIHDLQIYGAVDADVTRQLTKIQTKRIAKERSQVGRLMKSHGVPASRVLGRMQYRGTRVDQAYIDVLDTALGKVVEKTEAELYAAVDGVNPTGNPVNINNPTDIGNVLFAWGWKHPNDAGKLSIPYDIIERTKTDQPSTSEKILRPMIEYEDEEKTVPTARSYFIERLLTYRKASKARNTFLANIRALSKRDGFLHTQFHLNGTGTGRLSSSDMNMQNIPYILAGWNIKKLFIPSDDTFFIVNGDYSGAEVRVFTAYAPDKSLIRAINDGLDMHSFFASKVFHRPYEDYVNRESEDVITDKEYRKLLDKERTQIKRVVFGILYGAGPYKIAETIGVSKDEAQELIDLLFKMFPAIRDYIADVDKEVETQGYVETLFSRRRRFPLAGLSRHRGRSQRQARNFKIQSTSSDIVLSQLIEISDILERDFGGHMLLTVHDSMVLEFPKKYATQCKDFLLEYGQQRVQKKFPWMPVQFKLDIGAGPSYGECQKIDTYLAEQRFIARSEGIVEEQELLTELKDDVYAAAN